MRLFKSWTQLKVLNLLRLCLELLKQNYCKTIMKISSKLLKNRAKIAY